MTRLLPSHGIAPARTGSRHSEPCIDQWRLTRLLAVGRWTRVFRARPRASHGPELGDFVVKTLPAERAADPQSRALLRREAAVSRSATHPHLTSVLIDATPALRPYLVLPYLQGVTAADLLATAVLGADDREVRLPIATACLITRQAAEALNALHMRGWVHTNIQPTDVLVGPSGHTTLLDLGLARRIGSEECRGEFLATPTPGYSAPETFSANGWLTPAADVYSLGVVLHELLTGRPIFASKDCIDLVRQHRTMPAPDARELRPTVSHELAELLRRMLAKEPLRRPSAAQVVRWLTELEIEEVSML